MPCSLAKDAADAVWPALLAARASLSALSSSWSGCVYFYRSLGEWRHAMELPGALADVDRILSCPLGGANEALRDPAVNRTSAASTLRVSCFDLERFDHGEEPIQALRGPEFESAVRNVLRLYLPLLLGAGRSRMQGRSHVVAHIAQTLDGRIACGNGHSRWISNEANLVHSHRLRALCDAVIVGSRTVAADDPQLTVRHVTGSDPRRIVLNGSGSLLGCPEPRRVFADSGCLLICSETAPAASALPAGVEVLRLPVNRDGRGLDVDSLCSALRARGLWSLFLEGGGASLSSFVESGRLDLLHLHVAPLILGSGVSAFSLAEVTEIDAGRRCHVEHFSFDGEMLFECRGLRGEAPVERARSQHAG